MSQGGRIRLRGDPAFATRSSTIAPERLDMSGVRTWFRAVVAEGRGKEVVQQSVHALRKGRRRKERELAVKVLLCAVPGSLPHVKELVLGRIGSEHDRFICFCHVDDTVLPLGASPQRELLSWTEEYLLTVRSEAGYGAWMAGDLLGEHWPSLREAVPVLARAILEGRYAAGRLGALHGSAHAMVRLSSAGGRSHRILRDQLLGALRAAATKDRSPRVRAEARDVLDGTHACMATLRTPGT